MNIKTLYVAALLLFAAISKGQTALLPQLTDSEIQQFIEEAVTKENHAPGIVVGIINGTNSQVFASGTTRVGSNEKVDGDTLFQIGSITKVFTTLLLQDMVDHGEVKLNDPIGRFLPTSVKTPTRDGKEITLYHLATHTSGLPRLPFSLWYGAWHIKDVYAGFKLKDFYKFLSKHELERDIGTKFEYSNAGMQLLGHLLELQGRTNYEALVRERICKPLKMDNTYVVVPPQLTKRLASGHLPSRKAKDNPLEPMNPVPGWNPSDTPGAGELRSSVNDMLKFLSANMGVTPSGLSNAMRATHIPREPVGPHKTGLGWMIEGKSQVIWHNGGMWGYVSYIAFDPIGKRGVVILANSIQQVDAIGQTIIGLRKWRKVAPISSEVYKRYTGKYEFGPEKIMTVKRKDDRLFVQVTGQRKFEIFPESETAFFCKELDAQSTFITNETGVATGLVWHQNGSKGSLRNKLK